MMELFFIVFNLLFIALIFYLVIAFVTGAPYVPSTNPTAETMIRLANIKPGETVYDLGSGDGKLLFLAAKKDARAVGIEINPFLVLLSKLLHPKVSFRWQSFWKADLHDADVVFVYLLPWRMEKLAKFLKQQCKPGTRIVSNSFIFPGWPIETKDEKNHVYVFVV